MNSNTNMWKCLCVSVCFIIIPIYCGSQWQTINIPRNEVSTSKPQSVKYKHNYDLLYRNYVYREMSPAAKDIFYAINIHPSCKEKKGACIPRAQCRDRKMFYISRVCYTRDLVCCYEDYPPRDHPFVREKETANAKKDDSKADDLKSNDDKIEENLPNKDDAANPDKQNTMLKSGLRLGPEMEEENSSLSKAALLLPVKNSSSDWSLLFVSNITKEDIVKIVHPSVNVQQLNFSTILTNFPELIKTLDNIPPQSISTANVTTARAIALKDEKIEAVTVVPTTNQIFNKTNITMVHGEVEIGAILVP